MSGGVNYYGRLDLRKFRWWLFWMRIRKDSFEMSEFGTDDVRGCSKFGGASDLWYADKITASDGTSDSMRQATASNSMNTIRSNGIRRPLFWNPETKIWTKLKWLIQKNCEVLCGADAGESKYGQQTQWWQYLSKEKVWKNDSANQNRWKRLQRAHFMEASKDLEMIGKRKKARLENWGWGES